MNTLLLTFSMLFLTSCTTKTEMREPTTPLEDASLIEAVKNKRPALVREALKKGADVNTSDRRRRSLLLLATHANDLEMARLLVSHGADVNRQDDMQDSPFLYAGASGYTELVKLYLANGARFDIFNRYNGSALIPACERGHVEVVRVLANTPGFPIDHVNRLGWTALMEAVVLGNGGKNHIEVVRILTAAGCNVTIPDNDGVTALQHARARGYREIAGILEEVSKKKQ